MTNFSACCASRSSWQASACRSGPDHLGKKVAVAQQPVLVGRRGIYLPAVSAPVAREWITRNPTVLAVPQRPRWRRYPSWVYRWAAGVCAVAGVGIWWVALRDGTSSLTALLAFLLLRGAAVVLGLKPCRSASSAGTMRLRSTAVVNGLTRLSALSAGFAAVGPVSRAVADRLEELAEGADDGPSLLATIKSVPGSVSLDSMLMEIDKLRAVRRSAFPQPRWRTWRRRLSPGGVHGRWWRPRRTWPGTPRRCG